jgi:hypothetical protein
MIITDKSVVSEWVKALNEVNAFAKGKENPLYNSKYTDLASIIQGIDPILSKHGFKVVQEIVSNGAEIGIITVALHVSGESITANPMFATPVPSKTGVITPHAIGSTVTYLRRYTLMAFIGQASKDEDDDGNAGSNKVENPVEFYADKIKVATSMEDLTVIWKEISTDDRVDTSSVKALSLLIKSAKVKFQKEVHPDEVS